MIYKKTDIFGNETFEIIKSRKKKPKTLFDDYEGFVEKFKPKKTTDDCYTPPEVYDRVLKYVSKQIDLTGTEIIRPFYPGSDYREVDYGGNCIVIDNPPFSIVSKIARFYVERDIKFFLFAPHLTLFSAKIDCSRIVCGAEIEYENGAKIITSFLSNIFGDVRILSAPDLYRSLSEINKLKKKADLPKYRYPPNVLTVSMVQNLVEKGIFIRFDKSEVMIAENLDAQKAHKKAIYGKGFLLSEKAAEKKKEAERAAEKAAKKIAAEREAERAEKKEAEEKAAIIWELSEREKEIIKKLSEKQ